MLAVGAREIGDEGEEVSIMSRNATGCVCSPEAVHGGGEIDAVLAGQRQFGH